MPNKDYGLKAVGFRDSITRNLLTLSFHCININNIRTFIYFEDSIMRFNIDDQKTGSPGKRLPSRSVLAPVRTSQDRATCNIAGGQAFFIGCLCKDRDGASQASKCASLKLLFFLLMFGGIAAFPRVNFLSRIRSSPVKKKRRSRAQRGKRCGDHSALQTKTCDAKLYGVSVA